MSKKKATITRKRLDYFSDAFLEAVSRGNKSEALGIYAKGERLSTQLKKDESWLDYCSRVWKFYMMEEFTYEDHC